MTRPSSNMRRRWNARLRLSAAAVVAGLGITRVSSATTYYWIDGNGNWSNGLDWSLTQGGSSAGSDPTEGSNVDFIDSDGASRTINLDVTATIENLTIDQTGTGTGTNTLSIGSDTLNVTSNESIGNIGTGTLSQSGATNAVGISLELGNNNGSNGTYNLNSGTLTVGSGTTEENVGEANEIVGGSGTGTFNQIGGYNSVVNDLSVGGISGSTGTYNLGGGSLSVQANEYIGNTSGATATFTQNGGTNTLYGALYVGYNGGSRGTYTLNGGALEEGNGGEYVGEGGTGTFNQSGGSNYSFDGITVGDLGSSTGTYNLSGTATLGTYGPETIGNLGQGTFTQSGTSTNNTYEVQIGTGTGGNGLYTLNSGSLGANSFLGEIDIATGQNSTGTFTQNGGANTIAYYTGDQSASGSGNLVMGGASGAHATYNLNGGTLTAEGNEYIGNASGAIATFTQIAGTNTLSGDGDNGNLYIGTTPGSTGTYALSGGTLNVGNNVLIGLRAPSPGGNGTLTVSGTGVLNVAGGLLVNSSPASVNLEGGTINVGYLSIYPSQFNWTSGTLNITSIDGLSIDSEANINLGSSVSVGSGKTLGASVIYVGGDTEFGPTNAGTLTVSGGTVNVPSTSTTIVYNVAGTELNLESGTLSTGTLDLQGNNSHFAWTGGTLDLTSPSGIAIDSITGWNGYSSQTLNSGMTLEVAGAEVVGATGTGNITLNGGTNGIDYSNSLYVGYASGSTGSYNLNSGTLTDTGGNEYVGASGSGTFNQRGGTNLAGNELSIAQNSGSTGSYSLSGGTLTSASVYVGGSDTGTGGTGTLSVSGSGSLSAAIGITVYNTAGSALNINGGTVTAPSLNLVGSQGVYSQTGGTATFGQITGAGHIAIAGAQLGLTSDVQSQAGTLTVGAGSTLQFDIGTNAASELVAGTATFNAVPTIDFTLSGFPSAGTVFTLLSATHLNDNGNLNGLSSHPITINRETITPSFSDGSIIATISGGPANLTWNGNNGIGGDGGGSWDTQTTANWNNQGGTDVFYAGDNVTFDNSARNDTVDINSGNVTPSSVTFNNFYAFTVNGTYGITGATGLNDTGSGSVTLDNPNTYTGVTTISGGGTLSIANTNASPTFNVTNGTLQLASYGGLTATPVINLGADGTLDLDGTYNTISGLSGTTNSQISSSRYGAGLNYASGTSTYNGYIIDGNGQVSLTMTSGSLTLTGNSYYTGGTTINGGTLTAANGSSGSALGYGTVILNSGVLASGATGAIYANVLAGSGPHTIAPGGIGGIGTLTLGGLSTSNQTTIDFQPGTGEGQVNNGSQLILGTAEVSISPGTVLDFTGALDPGSHYRLIGDTDNGGVVDSINLSDFVLPSASGYSYTLSTTADPGYIDLLFASTGPASLTWNNTGAPAPTDGLNWDTTNNNWFSGAFPSTYADGDAVTFNDANNGNYSVTLNGVVNPLSVTVNNSAGNYLLSGTGSIGGATSLTKLGSAALTISTANTYSGGTTINDGTIIIGNAAALGTGPLTVDATGANSATLSPNGDTSYSLSNAINLQTNLNIGGSTNLTLTGTISNSGGLTMNGTGSLMLNGTNSFTGAVTVNSGTVVQNTSLIGNVINNATFTYNAGGFAGRLINEGVANINSNFIAGNGMENDSIVTLSGAPNLTFNGAGLDNEGLLSMYGGILSLSQTAANTNGGNLSLNGNTVMALGSAGVLNNNGTISLDGAVVTGATGTLNNNASGVVSGTGVIQSNFTNNGLVLGGAATTLAINKAFTNAGNINLQQTSLSGGAITNTGTIYGYGNVSNSVTNASGGTIEAADSTLDFSSLTNQAGGLLTVDDFAKLSVTPGLAANAGIINLTGGTFDNNGHALNNTGQISGYGIFRTGGAGLTNNGSVTFSGGITTVNGNVTNQSGEKITVAYNPAIFTGSVVNNGTFKATSTTVTFAGTYTGGFTSDPSTDVFENNVLVPVGDSITGGSGDQYEMSSGTFTNKGTFNNGGTLQSSDATTNTGNFTQTGTLTQSANFTNSGTATFGGTQTWSPGTTFTNTAGTTTFQSDAGSATALNLSLKITGGTVTLASPQHWAGLSILGAGSTLNIANNNAVIADTGGPDDATYTSILDYVKSGAITSTSDFLGYGVGVVDGNDAVSGAKVSAGTIDIAYTLYGDANLDGKVDATDFGIFAPNFGATGFTLGWEGGDFNYDGKVDATDFGLFAPNFGQSDSGTAVSLPTADYAALDAFAAANGLSLTSVPEPASLGLLTLGAVGFLLRRRRSW